MYFITNMLSVIVPSLPLFNNYSTEISPVITSLCYCLLIPLLLSIASASTWSY